MKVGRSGQGLWIDGRRRSRSSVSLCHQLREYRRAAAADATRRWISKRTTTKSQDAKTNSLPEKPDTHLLLDVPPPATPSLLDPPPWSSLLHIAFANRRSSEEGGRGSRTSDAGRGPDLRRPDGGTAVLPSWGPASGRGTTAAPVQPECGRRGGWRRPASMDGGRGGVALGEGALRPRRRQARRGEGVRPSPDLGGGGGGVRAVACPVEGRRADGLAEGAA